MCFKFLRYNVFLFKFLCSSGETSKTESLHKLRRSSRYCLKGGPGVYPTVLHFREKMSIQMCLNWLLAHFRTWSSATVRTAISRPRAQCAIGFTTMNARHHPTPLESPHSFVPKYSDTWKDHIQDFRSLLFSTSLGAHHTLKVHSVAGIPLSSKVNGQV